MDVDWLKGVGRQHPLEQTLSLRSFAETVMVRDERTVRRWRAGTVPIPAVATRRLEQYMRE